MREGRYQLAALGSRPPDPRLEGAPGVRLLSETSLHTRYLAFDLSHETTPFVPGRPNPFLDRRVRGAFHLALDRAALAESLSPLARPAGQLVPAFVLGFEPALSPPASDRSRARELLREAGLGAGFEATIHTRRILEPVAREVARQLAGIGVRLEVRALEDAPYFRGLDRRAFSVWTDRWGCTTGDASELFENALHTRDPGAGLGLFNETGHADPQLDRLIERATALEDAGSRGEALRATMRAALERLYWIPLVFDEERYALAGGLEWRPRYDMSIRLADVRLAPSP